ncbi:hypothetical protein [Streptomyces spirodelae]|uniref:Secreted protein n=1 Tax=Streptomyces spirodelae TaxID=2812904 RepID=A0ABS3WWQ9_9ACTN|nr:hypothetical protein [Streptomyces spirodelae]MBO8187579.1 hypothetical protein [Streptomyces spirodelae]
MTMRRTRNARRGVAAAALVTGLALTAAGCGGGDGGGEDDKKPAPSSGKEQGDTGSGSGKDETEGEPLAQVKGGKDGALTLTITSAVRDDGGFATLKGTVTNSGPSVVTLPDWQSDETELKKNGLSMAGATMVDKKEKKRYLVLRDTTGRCLCTRFRSGFPEGKSTQWYAQFPAPPPSTDKVDFQVADLPSATVELSGE